MICNIAISEGLSSRKLMLCIWSREYHELQTSIWSISVQLLHRQYKPRLPYSENDWKNSLENWKQCVFCKLFAIIFLYFKDNSFQSERMLLSLSSKSIWFQMIAKIFYLFSDDFYISDDVSKSTVFGVLQNDCKAPWYIPLNAVWFGCQETITCRI